MHRQRTKLSKRVNRVASSVERRGIVATYEIQDRVLGNRSARRRFASHVPELDETQRRHRRVARPRGVRVAAVHRARRRRSSGRRSTRRARPSSPRPSARSPRAAAARCGPARSSSSRAYSFEGVTLGPDDPWFSFCASRRMLDVANAYLRLWAKLSYVDLWYTAQQPATDERVASQNWHVDFDDKHLLKAFVYLTDVGPDHGPFEYVPGSQPGRAPPLGSPMDADGLRPRRRRGRRPSVPSRRDRDVHRPEGNAHPLQHERPAPRRLRHGRAAGARDGDVLLAGVAEGALEPQLLDDARRRPTRSSATPSRRSRDASAYSVVQSRSGQHAAAELTRVQALGRVAEARVVRRGT